MKYFRKFDMNSYDISSIGYMISISYSNVRFVYCKDIGGGGKIVLVSSSEFHIGYDLSNFQTIPIPRCA